MLFFDFEFCVITFSILFFFPKSVSLLRRDAGLKFRFEYMRVAYTYMHIAVCIAM